MDQEIGDVGAFERSIDALSALKVAAHVRDLTPSLVAARARCGRHDRPSPDQLRNQPRPNETRAVDDRDPRPG